MDPRLLLEAEYLARRQKNASYSLRAFANLLEIPSGRVSQLLSRKRRFTKKLGEKIALRLRLDPQKAHALLSGIERARTGASHKATEYQTLDMDHFRSIADPVHFALLSLLETRVFREAHIPERLGLSSLEARAAVDRLIRVGLVERSTNGKLRLAQGPGLTTSHDISSAALRESHQRVLAEAQRVIEEVGVELRDITSMTMAIDPARLPEAKKRLREFRRSLCEFLEAGRKEEVYRLNIQLVPVSKPVPKAVSKRVSTPQMRMKRRKQ